MYFSPQTLKPANGPTKRDIGAHTVSRFKLLRRHQQVVYMRKCHGEPGRVLL